MRAIFEIPSFAADWPSRKSFLLEKLGDPKKATRQNVLALGDSLSDTFRVVGSDDRSQGSLSSAGVVWESLVVWYLNLCLVGTEAVCLRGGKFAPDPVKYSLSIQHESTLLRTEPDVVVISLKSLNTPRPDLPGIKLTEAIEGFCAKEFGDIGLVNLQCKTSWNDNAQIPMLWNMLYNQARKGAVIPNGFTIGRNGYSLKGLGHFGYAFVTVPSQKLTKFKTTDLSVLRAKTMTAGNYWGYPTKSGVALSISEFFNFFNRNSKVFPDAAAIGKGAAAMFTSEDLSIFG